MKNLRNTLLAALLVAPGLAAAAEATPAAPTVQIGGLVDSYYSLNLDAPQTEASPLLGFSALPGLRLSYAELNAAVSAGPAGLRLDLGYGPTAVSGTTNFFVQQAYASLELGPVTADFGRFVTSAGAEVIEAKDNWLYSRSILFYNAIPFAHTGLRVGIPVAPGLTLQLGVLNGWDDDAAFDFAEPSPHKTFNASLFYSMDETLAAVNLYTGKEPGVADTRTLVDVVLQQGFGPVAVNLNLDYGTEGDATWWGVAGMARLAVSEALRLTARAEYFDDSDGFRLGVPDAKWYEGTLGLAYGVGANAEVRAEIRYDMASENVFRDGTEDRFITFQLAALAWF